MKTISSLAWSNLRQNRTRSILITVSIFLTTMLLAMIATFGYGSARHSTENAGLLYGDYYGDFRDVTQDALGQMELHSEFTDIGKQAVLGTVEAQENMYLLYVDHKAVAMTNMENMLEKGDYPGNGNEIAAQPSFFSQLGLENPAVGDEVTISYRKDLNTRFAPDTFVISGILKEPDTGIKSSVYSACISREYYEKIIPEQERAYKVYFKMDPTLGINADSAEYLMKELARQCGIPDKNVTVNSGYLTWKLNPGYEEILFCVMIAILVIFFSVMVIYNIFQVGIVQRVQEYGKLKAIGTTRKQMKQMVLREGLFLSLFGIPAGTAAGYGLGEAMYMFFTGMRSDEVVTGTLHRPSGFNLPLLLLAAALALFTVWLALKRPMKIVASISPVDAMRYQDGTWRNRGIRKGRREIGVTGMTLASLSSHKGRTLSTIVSMGLSCVLFLVIANLAGNLDAEYDARKTVEHGQFEVRLDTSLSDSAYPENNLDRVLVNNPLSEDLLESIRKIDGVTGVATQKALYADLKAPEEDSETTQNGLQPIRIIVMDREDFEHEMEGGTTLGTFDYDKTSAENGVVYGWVYFMEEEGYYIGQELELTLWDGMRKLPWKTTMMGSFGSLDGKMAMTEDTFASLGFSGNVTNKVWVDCLPADSARVEKELGELLTGVEHVEMESYADVLELSEAGFRMMKMCAYSLCLLIAFISFMNMSNTIITGIVTRKQEFGVLQAIGMTAGQMNRSLQMEGILLTFGTAAVSLAVGLPLGYILFFAAREHGITGLYQYHFPVAEVAVMVVLLAGLQAGLSFVLSRNVRKESLVERIRFGE